MYTESSKEPSLDINSSVAKELDDVRSILSDVISGFEDTCQTTKTTISLHVSILGVALKLSS